MRATVIVTLLVALGGGPASADVENLEEFLRGAEQATLVTTALRGDGQFDVTSVDGSRRDDIEMIVRPPTDTYLELRRAGIKAVLLNQTGQGYRVKPGDSTAGDFPVDAGFADSDFTREDLAPFRLANYKQPRISDETANEVTVTLFPTSPQYSLVVITFDRDKKVPRKTLYYRETLNNLVKMRRDDDYVLIGRKWLPTTTSMETFKLHTRTAFTMRWSQNTNFPPELFDPAFLIRSSGVIWPTAPPSAPK